MSMTCPLCQADGDFPVVTGDLRYPYDGAIYRCTSCGLVYLWPPMSPDEERRFYEEEYGTIFAAEKGSTPADLYAKQLPSARQYLDWCRDRLRPTDSCLEIGCASGYFLDTLKPHVANVAGCESHHLLRQHCEALGHTAWENLEQVEGRFDKIFLWFVFEHIGQPLPFLERLLEVLAPGGEIILIVPNIDDPLFSLYDIPAFRRFYFTPAHHYYYSPETLTAMVRQAGLACECRMVQRYDLSNHMHWMQAGKPGGQGKYDHVFSVELRQAYEASLLASGRADGIVAFLTRLPKE